ncbi:hypothetical protein ILYODFUR_010164 [Ilyodon furcidens]|uniref:Uncharacterized protein n=1 Tax=Ilyodon furcidens TaxID=33524 RepID=A0ABV0THH0_9TELE
MDTKNVPPLLLFMTPQLTHLAFGPMSYKADAHGFFLSLFYTEPFLVPIKLSKAVQPQNLSAQGFQCVSKSSIDEIYSSVPSVHSPLELSSVGPMNTGPQLTFFLSHVFPLSA